MIRNVKATLPVWCSVQCEAHISLDQTNSLFLDVCTLASVLNLFQSVAHSQTCPVYSQGVLICFPFYLLRRHQIDCQSQSKSVLIKIYSVRTRDARAGLSDDVIYLESVAELEPCMEPVEQVRRHQSARTVEMQFKKRLIIISCTF